MNNNSRISDDGFAGVELRRNRTKRIFLSGIANDFWPRFVICKLWQSKESSGKTTKPKPQTKTPQCENVSSYV